MFSADGSRVVTASEDKTARISDAATGQALAELKGHTGPVSSAVFSADGSRVLTASEDKTARIWDVESGAEVRALTGYHPAIFSPDGTRIINTSEHDPNTAVIYDTRPVNRAFLHVAPRTREKK